MRPESAVSLIEAGPTAVHDCCETELVGSCVKMRNGAVNWLATSAPAPAAPAADSNSPKPPEASSETAKSEGDKSDDEKKKAQVDALKQEIADKLEKVNLQQREIALAQDTFNSNPDRERDKAGKDNLDAMQSDLAQLQAQLTELQTKLAGLNPPSDERTPETPKP